MPSLGFCQHASPIVAIFFVTTSLPKICIWFIVISRSWQFFFPVWCHSTAGAVEGAVREGALCSVSLCLVLWEGGSCGNISVHFIFSITLIPLLVNRVTTVSWLAPWSDNSAVPCQVDCKGCSLTTGYRIQILPEANKYDYTSLIVLFRHKST